MAAAFVLLICADAAAPTEGIMGESGSAESWDREAQHSLSRWQDMRICGSVGDAVEMGRGIAMAEDEVEG